MRYITDHNIVCEILVSVVPDHSAQTYLDDAGMGITFGQHTFHMLSKALLSQLVHIIYSSHLMSTMVTKNLAGGADWLVVCQTVLQEREEIKLFQLHFMFTKTF